MHMLIVVLLEVSLQIQMEEIDHTLLLFSDKAWVSSQWICYLPEKQVMVAVQGAMNATSITDLFLLHGINNIRIGSPSLLLCKTVS